MTIGTFTLLTVTGSLLLIKLALMALAVVLLTKTLLPGRKWFAPSTGKPAAQRQGRPLICYV